MLLRLFLLVLFALSLPAGAHAAATTANEDYADITLANLARTLVRFSAYNLADPALMDEYAVVTECELYQAMYSDDFKWNKVRKAIRDSVRLNIATFPVSYRFDLPVQLERYDFNAKAFRFIAGTKLNNVNTFTIFSQQSACDRTPLKVLSHTFRVVLASPVFLENLPMPEKEAANLLKQMEVDGNGDRIIHAAFNLRIVYIDPLRKVTQGVMEDMTTEYHQSDLKDTRTIRLDARLDSIDFYEDKERLHLIYHYEP